MSNADQREIVLKHTLTPVEVAAISDLLRICNAYDGLDLKIEIAPPRRDDASSPYAVLCYVAGEIVGYCSLDGDSSDIEVCGMVHPDHRRKGIGRALLAAAVAECHRRGTENLILLCEEASRSGQAFVTALQAQFGYAEHRMVLGTLPPLTRRDPQLHVRRATAQDIPAIAAVRTTLFEGGEEAIARAVADTMADPTQRFYVAHLGATPVSTLRVSFDGERAFIYAFGVAAPYQGQGIGRQVLNDVIEDVRTEHSGVIGLEVDTTNTRAHRLYQTSGFHETTTYNYYGVAL